MDDINKFIDEEINPVLALHKGSCEAVSFESGVLKLRLNGGCVGCPSSRITLYTAVIPLLQERFKDTIDEFELE